VERKNKRYSSGFRVAVSSLPPDIRFNIQAAIAVYQILKPVMTGLLLNEIQSNVK
jgi:hypothetical protein